MKTTFFQYFITLLLLILISQGNSYFYPKPVFLILTITFLTGIAIFLKKGKFSQKMLTPFYFFLIIQVYYIWRFKTVYIGLPIKLLTATMIAYYFQLKLLRSYIKLMAVFAFISIIFSIFTLLDFKATYETLKSFSLLLGIDKNFHFDGQYYANIFIYTINQTDWFRNCGFMWEPGPFASLLSIAIFFEMTFNRFRFSFSLLTLIIALILTFSTTGYLSMLVLLMYWVMNKLDKRTIRWVLPLLIGLSVFILSLPFMFTKISNLSTINEKYIYENVKSDRITSLGRFNGLVLNIADWKKSPVFGVGSNKNTTGAQMFKTSINGLGVLLADFGVVGIMIVFFALYKSTAFLKKIFQYKFTIAFPALLIIHSFSFTINFSIFYLTLYFLYVAKFNSPDLNLGYKKLKY